MYGVENTPPAFIQDVNLHAIWSWRDNQLDILGVQFELRRRKVSIWGIDSYTNSFCLNLRLFKA